MLEVEHIGMISDEIRAVGGKRMARTRVQATAEEAAGLTVPLPLLTTADEVIE
jgi:hypothetical protein